MLKKTFILSIVVYLFSCSLAWATMFFPMPFEKQVEEANSGVEARLSASKVFKNNSGMIMTEYRFDVLESYNLSNDDLDKKQLVLTMPGGTYDGITSMIDGAPQFKIGEKTFLLLKKIESKIYLSNFTLGKFKLQEHEGKTYYISEVFPLDPNIGRISKDKMIDLMKEKWKISQNSSEESIPKMLVPFNNSPVLKSNGPRFEKRVPAQVDSVTEETPIFFWSALFLVIFFFGLIFFKLGKSEHQH